MTPGRTGDAHARYRRAVEHAAARILGDREEARDIASDTFVAMLESGPKDDGAELAWLLSTSRRRALNRVRDRARAARRALRVADRPEDHFELGIDENLTAIVREAFSRLSPRDRNALSMRYVDEESLDNVATALGLSAGAARVTIHRAGRRLRRETVRLLAEHHGLPKGCVDALARRAESGAAIQHPGCPSCLSIGDEVGALAAYGLTPLLLPRFVRRTGAFFDRLSARIPRTGRLTEAVAAIVMTTAMAAPGANTPVSDASMSSAASSLPKGRVSGSVDASLRAGRASRPAESLAMRSRFTSIDRSDSEGRPSVEAEGLPILDRISVPDPLQPGNPSAFDILRFDIATTGRHNRAEGMFVRIETAARPDRSGLYRFNWSLAESGCWGTLHHQGKLRINNALTELVIDCAATPATYISVRGLPERKWNVPLVAMFSDRAISFAFSFADLPADALSVFGPGTRMSDVVAESAHQSEAFFSFEDRAPDADGVEYRIPR